MTIWEIFSISILIFNNFVIAKYDKIFLDAYSNIEFDMEDEESKDVEEEVQEEIIYKKKPIYNFVNKFNFKISNLKTSPFFVDYSIKNKKHNIYEYSLKKLNELLKN